MTWKRKIILALAAGLVPGFIGANELAPPRPVNLAEIDFNVPWGLRQGQASRNYFTILIGPEGEVANAGLIRAVPHENYAGIAKSTLEKFRYSPEDAGRTYWDHLDYCILSDGQSTFACRIEITRLSGEAGQTAKDPGDKSFFRIDQYEGFPRVLESTLPEYPEQAAKRSICGFVRLSFQVSTRGKPRKIKILESTRGGTFTLSAVNAFKAFEFERPEGPMSLEYLVTFEIPGKCTVGR